MATGNSAAEAAEQAGIPQLDITAFPNQIFWLVVFLVVLYFIMKRVALPRIDGIIEHRSQRIREDLLQAESLNQEAERLREETGKRLAEAKSEADKITAAARVRIRKDQDAAIAAVNQQIGLKTSEAEARIEEIRQGAVENIGEIANDAAQEIVSRLMPGTVQAQYVQTAVRARMNGADQ